MYSRKQVIKNDYDKTAGVYDSRYADIQEEKYRVMLEDLELKQPILDVGSGTGLLQKFLNVKLCGIDISHGMLKHSKEL
jgi:ubiquinone/menaquinone biosynthesis C-methylase UbiE